ncbi:hypothetical protein [Izhakiella capsodis]|nr:hypothetical protein [Izhakiella capsodis]
MQSDYIDFSSDARWFRLVGQPVRFAAAGSDILWRLLAASKQHAIRGPV